MPKYELKDTSNGMVSPDYKERFIAEYTQTRVRYIKLKKYVGRIKYAKYADQPEPPHDCPVDLLEKQLFAMGAYLMTLEIRAKDYEHIELPKIEEEDV